MITTHSHMLVSDLPMNRSAVSLWRVWMVLLWQIKYRGIQMI